MLHLQLPITHPPFPRGSYRSLQGVADEIIADDVEVPNNSFTQPMRDKLSEAVKEFEAILKPNGKLPSLVHHK